MTEPDLAVSGDDQGEPDELLALFCSEVLAASSSWHDDVEQVVKGLVATELVAPIERLWRHARAIKAAALVCGLASAANLGGAMEATVERGRRERSLARSQGDALREALLWLTDLARAAPAELKVRGTTLSEVHRLVLSLSADSTATSPSATAPSKSTLPAAIPQPVDDSNTAHSAFVDSPLDSTIADLFELFRQEIEGHTAALSEGLLQLENNREDRSGLDPLMRAAHSLKGAARVMGLQPVVRLAHTMEDCFVAVQQGELQLPANAVDLLLRATDQLAQFGHIEASDFKRRAVECQPEMDELVQKLEAVRSGVAIVGQPEREPAPTPTALATVPPSATQAVRDDGGRDAERAVRVTAESLDRMVGLAGETLVESRWIESFGDGLVGLRRAQGDAFEVFDRLRAMSRPIGRADLDQELELLRREMGRGRRLILQRIAEIEDFQRRSLDISDRLYREALRSRMRPFADLSRTLPRTVRDLSRTLGKQARLEISGEDTPVDRDVMQRLEAPLGHLLRNALDHGLEGPAERVAANKSEVGICRLDVGHRGGMLSIVLSDDGRGVDLARVAQKVISKGLATTEMLDRMAEAELLEFLFLPGFTTAETVTDISGRGVGLDVVQTMVQQIGGVLRAETRKGLGTSFSMSVPITRAVMRTLIVEVHGEPLAFPLARIDRTLRVAQSTIQAIEGRQYFPLDGRAVGLVSGAQMLEWLGPTPTSDDLAVVVISAGDDVFGVVVDRFVGERDLVVRPLDRRLGRVRDINAAAILHDGSPVLIVDVDDLVRSIDNLLSGRRLQRVSGVASDVKPRKRVLVVDDSITVREVERGLLESNGYEVDVAVDGVDGLNAARAGGYDLIITDVDMPRMTGIELVAKLKADATLRAVPVMIVSYKDREEDRRRGLEVGADYYLTKSSFHDEKLLTAVLDLIGP